MQILAPPSLTPKKELSVEPIELTKDEKLEIIVPLAGEPKPEVTWTFNEATIKTDERRTITTDEDSTSLTIQKVIRDDTGEYSVTAENELGIETTTFKVEVQGGLT